LAVGKRRREEGMEITNYKKKAPFGQLEIIDNGQ
jgi:hypothetical protein